CARRESRSTVFSFGVVRNAEQFIHFWVRDSGAGMASEMLRHIFEPLYTTKRNGTGLGLAVTHQVVKRHGGELFVESRLKRGTTTPDAVILDVGLPDMDGRKVYERIVSMAPTLPVVFSTGHERSTRGEDTPNTAWLMKPYDLDVLLGALDRLSGAPAPSPERAGEAPAPH